MKEFAKMLGDGYFSITKLHRDDIKTQICTRYDFDEDDLPEEISKRVDAISDMDMESLAEDIEYAIMEDFWIMIDEWLNDHEEDIEKGIEDMRKEEDEDE